MNVGASHDGEDCDRASMPESFTMESPTRENTMPDRSLRTISRWGQACRRVPRGRISSRRDPSGECHGSKAPAGDSRDGEDQLGEWHTALIIVGEAHDGQDYAKASYHGQGRDGEPLPESLTIMETTRSESPTRENAMPERLFQRMS